MAAEHGRATADTETSDTPGAGLTHALLLDGRGGATSLDWEGVGQWTPERGCLWVHLHYEHPRAMHWVHQSSGVNDIARLFSATGAFEFTNSARW